MLRCTRFGGGTRKSRPPPLNYPKAEKGTLQNLDENHSRSAGRVTSPVNFAPSRPDFSLLLTSVILPALKNRYVTIGGNLAFCLLHTARYE